VAEIKEVPTGGARFERIGAHTHVKGLGLLPFTLFFSRKRPTPVFFVIAKSKFRDFQLLTWIPPMVSVRLCCFYDGFGS